MTQEQEKKTTYKITFKVTRDSVATTAKYPSRKNLEDATTYLSNRIKRGWPLAEIVKVEVVED